MANSIVAEPLNPQSGFNWVFLVELLICGILTVFFLFYFNRLFATVISYGIRAYTWRAYHAYIDIQALQFSLLGGRIFFKDVRYHGHNETILIHGGYITWNYWLRRVRDPDVFSERGSEMAAEEDGTSQTSSSQTSRSGNRSRNVDSAEKGGKQAPKKLPCRISIKVQGVEAFMYNRSPAYDGIIEAMQRKANSTPQEENDQTCAETDGTEEGSINGSVNTQSGEKQHHKKLKKTPGRGEPGVARADTDRSTAFESKKKPELPSFLRILPIHIDCTKGAVVIGNENTMAVITAQCEKASGELNASSSGPLDVYQQVFSFQFTHPVVHMKPNPDFKTTQMEAAARIKQEATNGVPEEDSTEKSIRPTKPRHWIRSFPGLSGLFSKSSDSINTHSKSNGRKNSRIFTSQWHLPGQERWKGLSRYLDQTQNDGHGEWDGVEYAKASLIVDCPHVNFIIYWDVPGPVPNEIDNSMHIDAARPEDINGSAPPEYGMDLQIFGGIINYGPWADRHRGVFQSIFFPGSHVDAVPASPLKTGEDRVLSVFKLDLTIEADTVLRIPVRETSKDWRWKGKAHTLAGNDKQGDKTKGKPRYRKRTMRGKQKDTTAAAQNVRPYAWIDVKVAGNSSVSYIMDMVASQTGYQNNLSVNVVGTEISSSVNHGLLWRSGAIGLNCDLSNPISWNALRKWVFNISCRDLELFLLRDHLFLLIDLVADWGSGPPSDYFTFVPFQYLLNLDLIDFKLHLNTNDGNIVNNPSDLDDNNFVTLYGQKIHGDVIIPLDKFRPLQNEIKFDVKGQDLGLEINMPSKNTLKTFVRNQDLAQLGSLTLTGSHTYMSETSTMNTDRLYMDIQGHRLYVELYGWLIHHFLKIKDNYFGDDLHFKTLEEFQGRQSRSLAVDGTEPHGEPSKISNDLDVILSIGVEEVSVIVPANLYSAEDSPRADLPYASADLRFTNYYMDLMVNFSPLSISLGQQVTSPGLPGDTSSGRTEIFIESIAVFGHRLFGLPPTEPTYVCNWDFDIGRISGECGSSLIEKAVGAARSFAFTFDDDENTVPITEIPIIHDSTFLRLSTQDVHLWFHVGTEALLFSSGPINLDFNDLAGISFSQRLNAWIPDLILGIVDGNTASRQRIRPGERQSVKTHAYLQTSVSFNMLKRKLHFTEERTKQQTHMQEEDRRTGRTPFMFIDYPSSSFHQRSRNLDNIRPPAMQYPEIPHPIFLFQPREADSPSSASSGYFSDLSSTRARQLRKPASRSTLHGSFANSIRSNRLRRKASNTSASSRSRTLLSGSPTHTESTRRFYTPLSEDIRVERNVGHSSVALSSSLAAPYFPLEQIQPDLSDVPSLPSLPSTFDDQLEDALLFNNVPTDHLSEELSHTSLIVSMAPGIQLYCTPEAIQCATKLFDIIQPERPEDILDEFQFNVMMKILGTQKRLEGKGESIEFSIRIPFTHVRFQNRFVPNLREEGGKDQYDIILNQLKVAARIRDNLEQPTGKKSVSLHTTLGSLGVSVTERTPHGRDNDVAVQAEMRDLLVWMAQDKESSLNVSFRSFETATASRKIEYLASLIHRTVRLSEELGSRFEEINKRQKHRLRFLVWFLTNAQDRYPDPAFLTKVTYALRASKDHLRNHDSWKIVSRFRYIWQCLPHEEKVKASEVCSRDDGYYPDCPDDAEEKVISMWDKWRTWDLAHVKRSLAMRMIFDSASTIEEDSSSASLYLTVRAADVKFMVDPGPKQSEAALQILTVNVAILPSQEPTGLMLVGTTPKRSTVVQISSRKSSLQVHWEICELLEVLVNKFQNEPTLSKTSPTTSIPKQPKKEEPPGSDHELHVVYITDKAQVILDTVNLRSVSKGQRFRISFVDADNQASKQGETMSAHVHLEMAMTELISRSRVLIRSQFDQPSLYFAQTEHPKGSEMPNAIKVAGASRMIRFQIQEHVLGLMEVVDSVLQDEVAYFHRQVTALKQSTKKTPEVPKQDDKVSQLPNVTLALLMDSYQVDLSLLESLTWSVTGTAGRISVIPALGKNMMLRIDYDLESHVHRMHSSTGAKSHVVCSFQFPPVNGRLIVTQAEKETKVSASGIIETIALQASEIQALIATINQPEISTVVHAIKDDIEVLKTHVEEIFPTTQSAVIKAPKPSRDIVFTVQATLSGLNVVASAPGKHPDSPTANLALRLSSVQLKATNHGQKQQVMASPEVVVQLHEISVEMTLSDAETIRRCGNLTFGAIFQVTAQDESEASRRAFCVYSSGLEINIFADTASAVVDVMNHMQDKIRDLDLSKEKKYLRRLRHNKSRISHKRDRSITSDTMPDNESAESGPLFTSTYSLELLDIQISWIVGTSVAPFAGVETEDLVLSFKRIHLSTRREVTARLEIENTQLQMVPISAYKKDRSRNSALLPEMIFHVTYLSTKDTRSISLKAAGKSLDLLLDSRFILPANVIERSIALAGKKFRTASANWSVTPTTSGAQRKNPFGNKRMAPLLVDASFAGAVVHINGSEPSSSQTTSSRQQQKGRYSQFVGDGTKSSMVLRAPGVELRVEYLDNGRDPALHAELRIDGSNNTLFPTVVPIMIDISESIKAVVREKDQDESSSSANPSEPLPKPGTKLLEEENLITADPSAILGRTRLNLGLRICKQEFSLSCQPIARVAAIAKLEDIYLTVNSVKSQDHGHFFAVSATFEKLQASVQHVYSRESTFGFDVESIILSMMNSKHISGTSGISAILKINPVGLQINARQLQDFLLFREIWVPPEIRQTSKPPEASISPEPQEYLMQRYQQVTAATAFPWNANVTIADIKVDLDLGQAIGKSSLHVHNMWASSKKGTDWEQNLCIGVEKIGIESTGRTSGFVELSNVKVRTSISWPEQSGVRQNPLVQASLGFGQLRVKAGFDYQAFAIADIANFDFLMYNVRERGEGARDRLVAILDGDKVQVFCHATSAAQGLALFQAIQRLVQENQQAYTQSLKDIEKFLRRKSSVATPGRSVSQSMITIKPDDDTFKAPISLHTDVVVTLRSINFGVYPSKFLDSQILMLEAADIQARFAVSLERGKIHSGLGMTLGQLSVALSSTTGPKGNKPVGGLTVEDIVESARSARGGTILRVPKVIATMNTWQAPKSNHIDYVFKSSLEGKVDVGWNYSRISYIKTMWSNHSRTLASRLGKPLPESNIKITSSQQAPASSTSTPLGSRPPTKPTAGGENQEKITAVVNVPQSKYNYTPLEPPVIETPQLRDMGEATPPLEWIGLHRDRLPNVTHQIVIVTLLEVAREVEDAYERILGTS